MNGRDWGESYSMENGAGCEYNMDNGYVEVYYLNGNILQIKCEEIEANLRTTEHSLAKLHKLLEDKPIEYVAMAFGRTASLLRYRGGYGKGYVRYDCSRLSETGIQ